MVFLFGLGYVALDAITMYASFQLDYKGVHDALLKSADEGFRTKEYTKNQEIGLRMDAEDIIYKKYPQGLDVILYFIPGVNLISSYVRSKKVTKLIGESKGYKKSLIPMTDEEKLEYSKLSDRKERVKFFRRVDEVKEINSEEEKEDVIQDSSDTNNQTELESLRSFKRSLQSENKQEKNIVKTKVYKK